MKLRDLTQITNIPRETVRRKLEFLAGKGWVVKTDAGWTVDESSDGSELRAFTKATMRRFLQTADELMGMLRNAHDQGPAGLPPRA
jgi:DNA-binding IclR family transcriptional regulator